MALVSKSLHEFRTRRDRGGLRSAVILTAIPLETRAVQAHLIDLARVTGRNGTIYRCGRFPCPNGDWFVAIAMTQPGNIGAATILGGTLRDFEEIDLALFVGVAGSPKADVQIGSVVASSHAYNVLSGKAGNTFEPRPRVIAASHPLVQVALQVATDGDWRARIRAPEGETLPEPRKYPCAFPPDAFVKPVASSDQLATSTNSPLYRAIKK